MITKIIGVILALGGLVVAGLSILSGERDLTAVGLTLIVIGCALIV